MHGSTCLAARGLLTALALLASGCGGDRATPEMSISFRSDAILEEANLIAIYFYDSSLQCGDLRLTVPRPASVLGPYTTNLDAAGQKAGIVSRIDDIPVDTYVVLVDALKRGGQIIGSGCAAGQQVFDRQIAPIQIVVTAQ